MHELHLLLDDFLDSAHSKYKHGCTVRALLFVVAVSGEGIADLLAYRLLVLRLHASGGIVSLALELVTDVLGSRLFRVGLEGSSSLVGERLSSGVRHD